MHWLLDVHAQILLQQQEVRNAHSEELMEIRHEEEMEMSDDDFEESPSKIPRIDESGKLSLFLALHSLAFN